MGSERTKKTWGMRDGEADGDSRNAIYESKHAKDVDRTPEADLEREKCKHDMKYFYDAVIALETRDKKTGKMKQQGLGRIHDFLIDMLTFELEGAPSHSPIFANLPPRDAEGNYAERWLYFPTLDTPPQIQDGPVGPITDMFYEAPKMWYGAIVRIKGDGLSKGIYCPRGHLKSTVCNQLFNLWRIIREPESRTMVRSSTSQLAKSFIQETKWNFETNEKFQRLFGDLGPPDKRKGAWNTDFFNVKTKYGWKTEGKEPTLWALGMNSEIVGGHFDMIMLDDVVGEKNSSTPDQLAKTNLSCQRLEAVRDPDTPMLDIGTRWAAEDAHGMYMGKERDWSFICCTVVDMSQKPLWPEKFTRASIARLRENIPDDKIYYGQYFNQHVGTTSRTFSTAWVTEYKGKPEEVAAHLGLNILIGIDTASGLKEQKGSLDFSSAFVLGQSPERDTFYFLDGFNERLTSDEIAEAVVDLALRWKGFMSSGATLMVGVEENAYTNFLHTALGYAQRLRGVDSLFNIIPLKTDNRKKADRIRLLARPYRDHRILWPEEQMIVSSLINPERMKAGTYDLKANLLAQFQGYPGIAHDDLLDAHAYAFEMTIPLEFKPENPKSVLARDASIHTREMALHEAEETGGEELYLG